MTAYNNSPRLATKSASSEQSPLSQAFSSKTSHQFPAHCWNLGTYTSLVKDGEAAAAVSVDLLILERASARSLSNSSSSLSLCLCLSVISPNFALHSAASLLSLSSSAWVTMAIYDARQKMTTKSTSSTKGWETKSTWSTMQIHSPTTEPITMANYIEFSLN